jgi:hypothetical protein
MADAITWEGRQSFLSKTIRELQAIAREAENTPLARRIDRIVDELDDFLEGTVNPAVREALDDEHKLARWSDPFGRPLHLRRCERESAAS